MEVSYFHLLHFHTNKLPAHPPFRYKVLKKFPNQNYIVSRLPIITRTAWKLNTKSVCSFGKHTLIYTTEVPKLMKIIKKISLRGIRWLRVNSLKCSRFYKSDDSKSGIFEEWDRVFDLLPAYSTKTLRPYPWKIRDTNVYLYYLLHTISTYSFHMLLHVSADILSHNRGVIFPRDTT
jgi:hypothetical protein